MSDAVVRDEIVPGARVVAVRRVTSIKRIELHGNVESVTDGAYPIKVRDDDGRLTGFEVEEVNVLSDPRW